MKKQQVSFDFEEYNSIGELNKNDRELIEIAQSLTESAYAPYSNFLVGAVARLSNGELIIGTNQENASYPVGICAERTLMATAATVYPDMPIETMAISYHSPNGVADTPISPCGMCRQALQEFEERTGMPVRLILAGQTGKVYIIEKASDLLPLAFSGRELRK